MGTGQKFESINEYEENGINTSNPTVASAKPGLGRSSALSQKTTHCLLQAKKLLATAQHWLVLVTQQHQ